MNQDQQDLAKSCFVAAEMDEGTPLLVFLSENMKISKSAVKAMLDSRHVFINRKRVWIAKYRIREGDIVEVYKSLRIHEECTPTVLYQDDYCAVICKPGGMLTLDEAGEKNSAETWVKTHFKNIQAKAVHRIDKETSGCLIFALANNAEEELVRLFRRHMIRKEYLAVICGSLTHRQGSLSQEIDGQRALTYFECLGQNSLASLVTVRIETGRTHQVRKHFAAEGHPLVGDKQYQLGNVKSSLLRGAPRQMLHAWKINFKPSWLKQEVSVICPPTKDFSSMLTKLKLDLYEPSK